MWLGSETFAGVAIFYVRGTASHVRWLTGSLVCCPSHPFILNGSFPDLRGLGARLSPFKAPFKAPPCFLLDRDVPTALRNVGVLPVSRLLG